MNRPIRTGFFLPEPLSLPYRAEKKGIFASEDSFKAENGKYFSSFLQVEPFP